MTYREFIRCLRDIADHLEESVNDSQNILHRDQISGDEDLFLFEFEDALGELYDNALGEHGRRVVEVNK